MRKPFFSETISLEPVRNCQLLSLLRFHDPKKYRLYKKGLRKLWLLTFKNVT